MSNTRLRAHTHTYKALIVGLKGDQFDALQRMLEGLPVSVRCVSPSKLLRLTGFKGLVVLTRFLNHKHSNHADLIAGDGVLRVSRGAASAVAEAIIAFFRLDAEVSNLRRST